MKTYVLFIALSLVVFTSSSARIRNGYERDIESAERSLRNLRTLLKEDKNLSVFQRLQISNKIDVLIGFVSYHELTDQFLEQFRMISPDLYYEIDSVKDRLGRALDVFVKFVPEKEMPAGVAGITIMEQDKSDRHACNSEYGIHTISVTIAAEKKSLFLLAHELGHVKYQAPNLADYQQFYVEFYLSNNYKTKGMGHSDKDSSGQQALDYAKRFRKSYLSYTRSEGSKIASHMSLLQRIRNGI